MEKEPIFICGHIKSGTSLLVSLLDSHSKLIVFPEELFLFDKFQKLKRDKKDNINDFWNLFFNDIQIKRFFGNNQKGLFGNVDYSNFNAKEFEKKCRNSFKDIKIKDNEKKIFEVIFKSFIEVQKDSFSKKWVEKSPKNENFFKKWIKYYPNAKFIYLKRDPFEVYSAIKRKREKEKIKYTIYNFIASYKESLKQAILFSKEFKDNFKIVEFNNLLENKEREIKNIIEFLSIEYEKTLLNPTKNGIPWNGNSMFRNNSSSKIEKDNLKEIRISTLTNFEKKMIDNFIIKDKFSLYYDLIFLFFDKYRYRRVRFSKKIK